MTNTQSEISEDEVARMLALEKQTASDSELLSYIVLLLRDIRESLRSIELEVTRHQ